MRAVASLYPRAESNCYLKFRKFLFYPLNYEGPYLAMWGQAPLLVACKDSEFILAPKGSPLGIISPASTRSPRNTPIGALARDAVGSTLPLPRGV